jgi:hypothetical protein
MCQQKQLPEKSAWQVSEEMLRVHVELRVWLEE